MRESGVRISFSLFPSNPMRARLLINALSSASALLLKPDLVNPDCIDEFGSSDLHWETGTELIEVKIPLEMTSYKELAEYLLIRKKLLPR